MKELTRDYHLQQNSQMSRLFRLADPNVTMIMISPIPLPIDLLAYYVKMLEIIGVENIDERLHYVTPV